MSRADLLRLAPPLLVLAVAVLLPFGRSAEAPLLLAAAAGLLLCWRGKLTLRRDHGPRLVLLLFACYWLPAVCSAFDSVVPGKSWQSVAADLRLLPFALLVAYAVRETALWSRVAAGIALIVALWVLDAWIQALTGFSLGGAADKEHLSGIFGAEDLKFGPVLAVLAPFVLLQARARFGRRGLALAGVLVLVPILLAGERSAWLSFALVTLVMLWRETRSPRHFALCSAAAAIAVLLVATVAWQTSGAFHARLQRSLLILQGTHGAVDEAAAGRLRIWHTALAMGAAHPINGVGVRGFRYAYAAYAQQGDSFVDPVSHEGAAHAHQIALEVFSETGAIGVLAWLLGAALALRAWWRAGTAVRERALAPGLALLAMCFPLNTHLAFYSAWWGLLFWWLLALYCAALESGAPAHPASEHAHAP